MHEPSLFFLGFCEIQSLPLTGVDYFSNVPPSAFAEADPWAGKVASALFETSKALFVPLFFYARVYLWAPHTRAFVANALGALRTMHAKRDRQSDRQGDHLGGVRQNGAGRTLAVFLAALAVITALQAYWALLILAEVSKAVGLGGAVAIVTEALAQ